jgi:ubiquinone/menaquinone biosynthesis C-methylase UbiE
MLLEALRPTDQWILDIGCGTGVFATRVLDCLPRAHVCGIDLSEGMLRKCQQRLEASGGAFSVVQGDSAHLPFADDTFDAVTCTHSFHHYPQQERAAREMHRVLRPGGRLMIIDGDRDRPWGRLVFDVVVVLMEGPVRHLSGRAFRDIFVSSGFEQISQRRRGGPLPFLLTIGEAVKPAQATPTRKAA